MDYSKRINEIRNVIPKNTKLIAVSKYVDEEEIQKVYACGVRDFAESKVQDAIRKKAKLKDLEDIKWHFVGHLQSNKIQRALNTFDWIHSVHSLELLKRIDSISAGIKVHPKLLMQVKLSEDPNKHGFEVSSLLNSLSFINSLQNSNIEGLMTILPFGLSQETNLRLFRKLKTLRTEISNKSFKNLNMNELSMGMSSDYREAIEAGTTMIRLGRAIFMP
ncbi:MAG: YggS family pyridoxal phosphate-dependent enzyme [Candidatus Caenarcaniphilales bacterium]|nr:YggS family pyridoxal phosphate-dependent enzyme [Candidatus Caenarcaniphilales bacterium]